MKILFYSIKGGQGKTTHAISYTKYKEALYLTNDFESGTLNIYQDIFKKNQLQVIGPKDNLNIPDNLDIVFDFGGWVDEKIKKITKMCDVVVVPLFYQSMADLLPCLKVVSSLSKYNHNIIVLINNTETKDIEDLKETLNKKLPQNKIFIINKSKYFIRLANEGKTIFDLSKESGLNKYILKNLVKQIKEFYKYLNNF